MTEPPTPEEPEHAPRRRPPFLASIATVLAILAVAWLFLGPYVTGDLIIPVGSDTKKYLWRTNLVIGQGMEALAHPPEPRFWSNPDRPGFPAIVALVRSVYGITPFGFAYLFPALMATALAAAAGAFARRVLGEPAWAVPIYILATGTSLQLAATVSPGGYLDNLLVNPVLMAAATLLIVSAATERGATGAVLLVVGAMLMHWVFASIFVAMALALGALLIPASISMLRSGERLLSTPSVRLGGIAGASVLAGIGALALAPTFPTRQPAVPIDALREKTEQRIGQFLLPLTVPLAAVGGAALARPADSRRRWGLLFVGIWALSGPVSYLAYLAGISAPSYRFLGFAHGIPLLMAAALSGAGRILGRRLPRIAPVVVAPLVILLLGYLALQTSDVFLSTRTTVTPAQLAESQTANRYLEAVGGERPVVFPVTRFPGRRAVNILRSGLSGEVLPRVVQFVGAPLELYGNEPPTREGDESFNRKAAGAWPAARAAAQRDPIVIVLPALNTPQREDSGGVWIGTQALVVEGPEPPRPVEPVPQLSATSRPELIVRFLGVLGLLLAVGGGWTAATLRASPGVTAGIAPAFGLAVMALAGVIAGRLGVPLAGAPAVVLVALTALAGWGLAGWAAIRTRPRAHAAS